MMNPNIRPDAVKAESLDEFTGASTISVQRNSNTGIDLTRADIEVP
jgi:hypothetical protein